MKWWVGQILMWVMVYVPVAIAVFGFLAWMVLGALDWMGWFRSREQPPSDPPPPEKVP